MANPFDDYLEKSLAERALPKEQYREDFVPFYPSKKYLEKNWKPEQYPREAIEQIARAQALGQKNGAFSPDYASYFFPTQLIENRPEDFGTRGEPFFVQGNLAAREALAAKFNLPPRLDLGGNMLTGHLTHNLPIPSNAPAHYKYPENSVELDRLKAEENARIAALIFAQKGQGRTPEQGAERWNGKGQRRLMSGEIMADSKNHLSKVQTMLQMLDHPANAEIKKVWQQYYGQALKE